ncbi:LOW QUALITY PROTEIN: telomerase protein component 1-like [Pecten maximus]|uniref:LOW QUALITY PROTEIN: telomerase protein component 1-like n=1 Tax=Pecten maximus TaxID=6579 RepID=UPI0014587D30|nr:LOW QUALITY PROTEIN: telomerase protein component 1-like [Pecten maximus]
MDTSGSKLVSKWSVKPSPGLTLAGGRSTGLSLTGGSTNLQSPLLSSLQQKTSTSDYGKLGKHKSSTKETVLTDKKKNKLQDSRVKTAPSLLSSHLGDSSLLKSNLQSKLVGLSLSGQSPLLSASSLRTQSATSYRTPLMSMTDGSSKLQSQLKPQLSTTLIGKSSLTGSLSTGFSTTHGSIVPGKSSLLGQQSSEKSKLLDASSLSSKTVSGATKSKKPGKRSHDQVSEKKEKKTKSKGIISEEQMQMLAMKRYKIVTPEYDLSQVLELPMSAQMSNRDEFLDVDKDPFLNRIHVPLHDVNGMKLAFINAVSGSLICQPNFRNANDLTRKSLTVMAERVVPFDPEFILKVALYTRKELNIRTTANFLLAMAANVHPCRPYLKKYYVKSIALPSDWIEVAEIYQAFHDKTISQGAIPAALRKVMITKFPSFDKYQLAKYNKDSSKKKKKKKTKEDENTTTSATRGGGQFRGRGRGRGGGRGRGRGGFSAPEPVIEKKKKKKKSMFDSDSSDSSDSDSEDELLKRQISDIVYDERESESELSQAKFSLKQLIRKLHIVEPVEHVMCLVGKRYPDNMETFYQSRLPGTFEEERAGKRMKLPIPETWETQVSLKGNKAKTWEDLIDHNKLPFMAMLRNLRNVIKAGISEKHHTNILHRLTNERQVVNSKQFPFRFFSAYEVLGNLEKDYEKSQSEIVRAAEIATGTTNPYDTSTPVTRGRGRGRGARGGALGGKKANPEMWWLDKKKNKNKGPQETLFDLQLITRYKKALDKSVKIATTYNVQPIRGRTIVLCDIGPSMEVNCTAAKGLGKPRQMKEVAVLLGLMCKYSCEECDLMAFTPTTYFNVQLKPGTILENMDVVLDPMTLTNAEFASTESMPFMLPHKILSDALRDRVQVDNLIFLSGGDNVPTQQQYLSTFLKKYREIVNQNLLYVNISFAGKNCGFSESITPEHDNDIYISGYSDQILRFIAERGEGGQLRHVEKIDEAFDLRPMPATSSDRGNKPKLERPAKPLPIVSNSPSWKTLRVFISSTFRDMHGERDILTRNIFPELRALTKKHFINIYEVDLRWGVTENDTKTNRTMELCLSEVKQCNLFLGILGERYGWIPEKYIVPDTAEYDWVRESKPGMSVTEMEMYAGALSQPQESQQTAFFFLRDSQFEKNIPPEFTSDFVAENAECKEKMAALKSRIRNSGLEVYDKYPCHWGGVAEDKPLVSGLELFGARVLNNLWNSINKLYIEQAEVLDENTHTTKQHQAMLERHQENFVGRKAMIKECLKQLQSVPSGILGLVGKPGTGKSAVMASLVHSYVESAMCDSAMSVLTHVVGAAPGSTNILATLRRLTHEVKRRFGLVKEVPEDFKNLSQVFGEMLEEAASMCGSPLLVFIDGIDIMESAYQPDNLEWLPTPVPKNVTFVLTVLDGGKCHKSIQRHKGQEVSVGGLDMWDKADVVRTTLATHRKTLDETPFNNQLKLLLSKKEASVPLFLKLACEELRVFGVFEKVSNKLKSLPHTVQQLLQEVLARLENDLGKETVIMAMSLLICAREGLDAEELHELLSLKLLLGNTRISVQGVINIHLGQENLIPPLIFSQIKRSLQTFLNPQDRWSTRLSLAHADIATAVRQRYLRGSAAEQEFSLHKLLAGYFYRQADPEKDHSFRGNSTRAYCELPYHLSCAGEFKELQDILCDIKFIDRKFELGLGPRLMDDFQVKVFVNKTMDRDQNKMVASDSFQQFKMFVSRNMHILTSYPGLTWQQAINEPSDSLPAQQAVSLPRDVNEKQYIEWNNKPGTKDPCYLTMDNLPQPVMCVAISQDCQYFVCGGLDGVVRLYNMETGKEVHTYRGHSDAVSDVCFVSKSFLCSASHDNSLSIWHVEDGHRVHLLKGHTRRVKSCAADPAGKLVASGSWDCTVKVWEASKGSVSCTLNVGSPVNSVSFHPEGQLIVTGSWDATIKIWDVFHKKRKAVLRGHSTSVRDVAYSPTGRHIASAALDGDVKIWAAQSGTQVGSIQGHAEPINKLIYSPTGKELITVSDDHKVKVWSGHLGLTLLKLGEEGGEPIVSICLNPDCSNVALGYHTGIVKVFDVFTGFELWSTQLHTSRVRGLRYSHDGIFLFTGADDCTSKVVRANDGKHVCAMSSHSKPVMCVATVKKYLATGGEDCQCYVYPTVWTKGGKCPKMVKSVACLGNHTGAVTSCAFSPNERQLATASRDMSVMIWELRMSLLDSSTAPLQVFHSCHKDWVTSCSWFGDFLVTASNDFTLKVWDVKTGTEKQSMTGHMSSISSVTYKYGCIVSSCNDGSVKVWSHKGTEITTLHSHQRAAHACDLYVRVAESDKLNISDEMDWSAAVTAEESETKKVYKPAVKLEEVIVATCGDDGTAVLWKPLQANEMASLTGHSDRVVSVAANKDGHLCTTSLDKAIRLWEPQLSTESATGVHNAPVTVVETSPDKSILLTGSRDGVLKMWHKSSDSSTPNCAMSLQAHKKSVNAACFLAPNIFVTGGDDGQIIVWNIYKKTRSGQIVPLCQKHKVFSTISPVTALATSSELDSNAGHIFVSGEWCGKLTVWNTAQQNKLSESFDFGKSDWILGIKFRTSTATPTFHVATANGYVCRGTMNKLGQKLTSVDSYYIPPASSVPVHRQVPVRILGLTTSNNDSYAVTSTGQISTSKRQMNSHTETKIHSAAVTCVATSEQFVFTGAHDCTVKVWRRQDSKLKQVGLFFCPAPVESLVVTNQSESTTEKSMVRLVCGDQLGNIHYLTWRQ